MKTNFILLLIVPVMLSGCATSIREARYGKDKPQISYVMGGKEIKDRIYVWNPNSTAAYINQSGDFCVSTADVFKTRNTQFYAVAKAWAIKGVSNLDTSANLKLLEQATKLSEKDAAGTFLSIALFNICMISSNEDLSADQTAELINNAINKAAELAVTGGNAEP